ncbi:MAG TPA: transporter [Gemmatales bacterium]|nr:transporter [Gemmatales bacterium]
MTLSKLFLIVGFFPLLSLGCATCSCPATPESEKGPKTLLSWEIGPKKEEDKDKEKEKKENGKDKADKSDEESKNKEKDKSEAEPEADKIQTDRPDFTESSTTVGKGRVQLESGYTYSRSKDAALQASHSYPEALLRVGLFADWFELRIGQNFSNTKKPGDDGSVFATSGGEDMYLGTKIALTEQKKYLPETALILQMTVPTGSNNLSAEKTLPGLNYLFGWEVNEFLNLGGSVQGNSTVDENGHTYLELAQSITVGYKLTEKLGAYTEWFAFYPTGATSPDVTAQHYLDGGFTYKITPLFQLDIRGGKGLTHSADDYFFGAGFAVKY